MNWRDALVLNSQCEVVGGSPEALREDIAGGADLRIYTGFRHKDHLDTSSSSEEMVDEVSDFRVTYLVDGRWAAGIMTQRMPINPPVGFGPRASMSFFLYNENGRQAIARPYLDGAAERGEPGPCAVQGHEDMPRYDEHSRYDDATNAPSSNFTYAFESFRFITNASWREVLSHDAEGAVRGGSLEALVEAFRSGCEIRLGIEGLCADLVAEGEALAHTVFVHGGPGYYHREQELFCLGSQPLVRVAPQIPMQYGSGNWDFGWLFVRTNGMVEYWRCDPYTLEFNKVSKRHALRWMVR